MDMFPGDARGRVRGPRRRISRGAKILSSAAVPRRGLAALRFFSQRRRSGSAGEITQPPRWIRRSGVLLRASLFRWRVRGKSSGRLIGFLHAFIPLSVRGPSRTRSEASARPWRRKKVDPSLSIQLKGRFPPDSPAGTRHRQRCKDRGRTKRLFRIATSNHAPIAINKGAALHIGC